MLGARILIEFIEATPETTPETAAGIVRRARAWASDLKPLVAPFGDVAASRFETLTPISRHDLATVEYCAPRDPRFNRDRDKHAIRVFRLDELFQRITLTPPKAPGGKRRTPRGRKKGDGTIDDTEVLAKMARLIQSGEAKSVLDAARQVEEFALGSGTEQSTIDRLRKKYKASDFKSNLSN